MESRVFVVADPPEAARVAAWLREDLGIEVRVGDGSDETLTELLTVAAEVVVLSASLARGDALAFAGAVRDSDSRDVSLVLIADESGPVRNALDAMPFRADRFLRRPLSRSALVFAVRSCLNLGRAGVVGSIDAAPSPGASPAVAPVAAALSVLDNIVPSPQLSGVLISSGVAQHTLVTRIDQATTEAIEAFLVDAVEQVLSDPPEAPFAEDDLAFAPHTTHAPAAPPPAARWRESTLVLSGTPPPAAPEPRRTGTFIAALRKQLSAVETRLFGRPAPAAPPEDNSEDIDLDSFGATTITHLTDEEVVVTDLGEPAEVAGPAPAVAPIDLAVEDPASVFGRLAREGLTARVSFRHGDAHQDAGKTVWLEDGRPVFAASADAADRMGEMLVREGKISREQHQRCREVLAASGRRVGEILVEQGALKRRELYPAVRRHIEDLLYSLFAWEDGWATSTAGGSARDEKIRLAAPAAALVCEGIRRKMSLERLRALVGPPHTVIVPRKADDLAHALADADLAADERRLAAMFDGRRTLAELIEDSGAERAELTFYQLAHLAAALGLLAPSTTDAEDAARTTGVGGGGIDSGIDRERVLSKYSQVLEADYFELLGVRRDATAFEVRRAFEAARRDFAPEGFAVDVQRELAAELAAIGEVLGEAQRILHDDELRTSYRDHLIDLGD